MNYFPTYFPVSSTHLTKQCSASVAVVTFSLTQKSMLRSIMDPCYVDGHDRVTRVWLIKCWLAWTLKLIRPILNDRHWRRSLTVHNIQRSLISLYHFPSKNKNRIQTNDIALYPVSKSHGHVRFHALSKQNLVSDSVDGNHLRDSKSLLR